MRKEIGICPFPFLFLIDYNTCSQLETVIWQLRKIIAFWQLREQLLEKKKKKKENRMNTSFKRCVHILTAIRQLIYIKNVNIY